ncbi:MAG: DUF1801 domain-containing protein [Candidatus Woesearchaeota archaeon]|nr:DUF1801 domain-containing protein [Nanoarchaeota archaeon]USN44312.1 MAG: DUF1801 domain-containing protein [Candidatus Woesearchaeota archaeon]
MNSDIDKYIADFEGGVQERLQMLRKVCLNAFPGAEESFKWGKPAFSLKRVLIVYAAYKHHIGFYPTPEVLTEFSDEIKKYTFAKGSVQFKHTEPFPIKLIENMAKARYKHYLEKDAKWKDPKGCN